MVSLIPTRMNSVDVDHRAKEDNSMVRNDTKHLHWSICGHYSAKH